MTPVSFSESSQTISNAGRPASAPITQNRRVIDRVNSEIPPILATKNTPNVRYFVHLISPARNSPNTGATPETITPQEPPFLTRPTIAYRPSTPIIEKGGLDIEEGGLTTEEGDLALLFAVSANYVQETINLLFGTTIFSFRPETLTRAGTIAHTANPEIFTLLNNYVELCIVDDNIRRNPDLASWVE